MSAEETRSALTIESSEPAYSFQPLGEKEIRLLTLHAGETDDPIKTILSHTSFNEDLNYEALSYVWGKSIAKEPAVTDPEVEVQLALQWITKDKPFNGRPKVEKVKWKDFPRHEHSYMYYQQGGPRLPEQITCNEVPITIGGELCSALKRLRKPDADRVLWIDALTINQADLDERANQVGLMHDIFARSKRVLIWLGENYSDVDDAPETIHKIAAKLVPFWKGAQTEENAELMALRSNAFKSDPAVRSLNWDSLAELLKRAWFQRASASLVLLTEMLIDDYRFGVFKRS